MGKAKKKSSIATRSVSGSSPTPILTPLRVGLISSIPLLVGFTAFLLGWIPSTAPDDPSPRSLGAPTIADLDSALTRARGFGEAYPFRAIDFLEETLLTWGDDPLRVSLLDQLGDLHRTVHQYGEAVKYHNESLIIRSANPEVTLADVVVGHAAVATDLYLDFKYPHALQLLSHLNSRYGKELPNTAKAIVMKLQSRVFECSGDFISALHLFEGSLNFDRGLDGGSPYETLQLHLDLLNRVLQDEKPPANVAKPMEKTRALLSKVMVEKGPWSTIQQLPKQYIPGLKSQPWHEPSTWSDVVPPLVQYLEAAWTKLRAEYMKLAAAGVLLRDRECIHDAAGGHWTRFEPTALWQRDLDDNGCSRTSPVACEFIQSLKGVSKVPVLRAGYSVLGPKAWIKPHFGVTNGQLKLHLGLVIPEKGCAEMRVGNVTRAWVEGECLFFDDSWEHEVRSKCDGPRAVFQLVVQHPDLSKVDPDRKLFSTPRPGH